MTPSVAETVLHLPSMQLVCITRGEHHLQDIQRHLHPLGHQVDACLEPFSLRDKVQPLTWDVAILDLTCLPEETLTFLREQFPRLMVLALTADGVSGVVRALTLQADSAMEVPVDWSELEARLHVLWRFKHRRSVLHVQGWWLCHQVLYHQRRSVELTPAEERLLRVLMRSAGVVHSRGVLQHSVYFGQRGVKCRNVDGLICRLRQKIPDLPVHTVRAEGYVFNLNV